MMLNIIKRCLVTMLLLGAYSQIVYADTPAQQKTIQGNTEWPFRYFAEGHNGMPTMACEGGNKLICDIKPSIYIQEAGSGEGLTPYAAYVYYFDHFGNVLDPETKQLTQWGGKYEPVPNHAHLYKVSLWEKTDSNPDNFHLLGYYDPIKDRFYGKFNEADDDKPYVYNFGSSERNVSTRCAPKNDCRNLNNKVIDVTDYDSDDAPMPDQFVGYRRFIDPIKPVIALNADTWYCFIDCPNNQPAGILTDKSLIPHHNWK
ncbi:hypothetical protein [Sulfuriferula nivalis]|uniref:YHYH domain-containing protein n=1 Tax=Sulfuriferula nivalis TaxID=2675298 RepID=A0A809SIC0_9PROT|nr:hypothetical protein [Sulfuriferula nivalis]BBP01660.1 hypothetical protein SFSGTM_23680 [Sulfuriferula nivalis]